MKPSLKKDCGQRDLFRSRLDQIINMNHLLVMLSELLDWERLAQALDLIILKWDTLEFPCA
jgi:IS5 family transposase